VVAHRRWRELSPRSRRLIVVGAVVEGVLKIAALVDIARRPAVGIRGSRWAWVAVVVLVNSVGAAPLAYFRFGRRPAGEGTGAALLIPGLIPG
jgi:Phospholipase_D-nuclease N-terminal